MKIVAQDQQTPDPRFELMYFVVDDDAYDPTTDDRHSKAWVISTKKPELRPVFNGTLALSHGGWYPFTGDPAVLDELLAASTA